MNKIKFSILFLVPLQLSSYQDEGHWYRLPLINFSQYYLVATVLASFLFFNISSAQADDDIQLWITRHFTGEKILAKTVLLSSNKSVMQILKENASVQTTFGGGFVSEINGKSGGGSQGDWFYYVNGLLANVGAAGYRPKTNDIIWWDFHPWQDAVYVSSVIGVYPQPFVSRRENQMPVTDILATVSLKTTAEELCNDLEQKGIYYQVIVKCQEYNGHLSPEAERARILVGAWKDISEDPAIKDIVRNSQKSGFFIKMEDAQLCPLNISGDVQTCYPNAAVILSISSGFETAPPLWLITGTSDKEVEKALRLLISNSEKIKFYSGAVLANGEIINVPVLR